ncbi:hypothetical protein LJB95_02195 [Paludibacteraceae bacterium OttesenSCG-928-F17]|nr:hypothetical protein [Paludibacteraceae bacterium OttesenSCG-928-F17]
MKKIIYVLICVLAVSFASCNKKAENVQDLKAKYEGKSFDDCKKFFPAYQEIMDVYFATIDRAYEGDESAFAEIEGFEPFFSTLSEDTEKIAVECPEKFAEFNKNLETTMQSYFPKLMEIVSRNMNFDDINMDELDLELNPDAELILEEGGEEVNVIEE